MLEFHKDELPPTIAGILELECKEGREEAIAKLVKRLLEEGLSVEFVAKVAELPIKQVLEMKDRYSL